MSRAMTELRGALGRGGSAYWLRDARAPACLLDGPALPVDAEGLSRIDLRIEAGRIAAIAPAGTAAHGPALDGGQVWPGLVDGHTHIDKGHIWPRMPNADGTFGGAIGAVMADRGANWSIEDMRARADFALRAAYAHGTVALRTHLDSYMPHAPNAWAMFSALRDAWAGRIALQASSIAPLDRFAGEEGAQLADIVAESGGVLGMVSRLTGGLHDDLPAEFQPMLDRFFALAEERDLALDLHVDESGETGARALREIAATAWKRGFKRPIQCGHCCALSLQPDDFAAETIRLCAEAGIAVIVLPMCNMYLQDRVPGRTPRWRGVTLVHEMRAAGIPVSVASDNTRDPFYAYGDLDMVEVFRESARILHFDHPFGDWPRAAAATPAAAMGLAGHGTIRVGAVADLILFRGRVMTELLSRPQSDRIVLRAGRVLEAEPPDWRELDRLFTSG
jgi:cytosine deaminase